MASILDLNSLITVGDDQIQSQYAILWPDGIPHSTVDPRLLTYRADQSFELPSRESGSYSVYFQGLKVEKPAFTDSTDKTFTLQFRIDAQWLVHDALENWYNNAFNDITGRVGSEAANRTTMLMQMFNGLSENPTKTFRWRGVRIKGFKSGSVTPESTDPMRCDASFIYHIFDRL